MADKSAYGGAPRWVKIFGIVAIVLILLYVILHLAGVGGPHGPGRHSRCDDASGQTPPAGIIVHFGAPRGSQESVPSEVGHA